MGVYVRAVVAHPFEYDARALLRALDAAWYDGAWVFEAGPDQETLDEGTCTIVGPDRLLAFCTPYLVSFAAATRWRWFLIDADARRAASVLFLTAAKALRAKHLVIIPDWAEEEALATPASATFNDVAEHLRSTLGTEQLDTDSISSSIRAEAEHDSPAVWFLLHLHPL